MFFFHFSRSPSKSKSGHLSENPWALYERAKFIGANARNAKDKKQCSRVFNQCPLSSDEVLEAIRKPRKLCVNEAGIPEINPSEVDEISEHIINNLMEKRNQRKENDLKSNNQNQKPL